jgi:hypothetical protein
LSPYTDGHQELSFGTEFHHGVAVLIADPDVVLCVDGHAVCLVLVADHVVADGADEPVILIKLKQLRFSGGVALKSKEVAFRIDRDCRNTAPAFG